MTLTVTTFDLGSCYSRHYFLTTHHRPTSPITSFDLRLPILGVLVSCEGVDDGRIQQDSEYDPKLTEQSDFSTHPGANDHKVLKRHKTITSAFIRKRASAFLVVSADSFFSNLFGCNSKADFSTSDSGLCGRFKRGITSVVPVDKPHTCF